MSDIQRSPRPAATWTVIGRLTIGSFAAEVSKMSSFGKPKYSYCLGTIVGEDFKRFIPVYTVGQGKIEVDKYKTLDLTAAVVALEKEVLKFIVEDAQLAEDAFIDRKQEKENRFVRKPEGKKVYKGPRQNGDARR